MKLKDDIAGRRIMEANANDSRIDQVPDSLVTSSASGLDPHIPLEALHFQVPRIAKARGLNDAALEKLHQLIAKQLHTPWPRLSSKSYANVLSLNIALDEAFGKMGQ